MSFCGVWNGCGYEVTGTTCPVCENEIEICVNIEEMVNKIYNVTINYTKTCDKITLLMTGRNSTFQTYDSKLGLVTIVFRNGVADLYISNNNALNNAASCFILKRPRVCRCKCNCRKCCRCDRH